MLWKWSWRFLCRNNSAKVEWQKGKYSFINTIKRMKILRKGRMSMLYICRCTRIGVIDNDIENVWAHSFHMLLIYEHPIVRKMMEPRDKWNKTKILKFSISLRFCRFLSFTSSHCIINFALFKFGFLCSIKHWTQFIESRFAVQLEF